MRAALMVMVVLGCATPRPRPSEQEPPATAVEATPRNPATVRAFRKTHPCPATGKTSGACPGWVVDHGIPLCAGGPDDPRNLDWQTEEDAKWKDAHERALCARLRACDANAAR
jgi:hypothetical protein